MTSASRSLATRLAAAHDAVTKFGCVVAGVLLVVIVLSYCYEVVARYFFSSPTTWATAVVSFLLCYIVFLVIPELSRQRSHIYISIVLDVLPKRVSRILLLFGYAIAAGACLLAAYFCFDATMAQYTRNIMTVSEWSVPKWAISVVIPYGFLSTSIYYIRHLFSGQGPANTEALQI
jgi:TRAP-type C4-dicarboxylate transport system permease small subunit